jgi:TolB-like protein/Flp pilus assembly protein TadD
MFTDIQGYTAMTQRDEASAMKTLRTYRALVSPVLSKHSGREVKTMGDGSLVEFGSALEATECAIDMQKVLHEYNQTSHAQLPVRIGIHVGDVIHSGGDVYGDAVNIASRIEPLAKGGGVCISGQVYFQVRNKIPYGANKVETVEMKNVSYPTEVYALELPWGREEFETPETPRRQRFAVLPFANISPDPSDEYFADGLTEELITVLSKVKGLEVIARTSVLRYKDSGKQVATIGNELKVGSVLEGSVRKAGNRIRVTAQLIDATNESHMWAETYDRQLDDIFAVQSDIAGKVSEALRLELTAPKDWNQGAAQNLEAYTLLLKGRFGSTKLDKDSLLKAIDLYGKAIAIQPDYAAAYAASAQAWLILGFFEFVDPQVAFPKAKEQALKAMELDNKTADGHVAMGRLLRMFEWKFVEADKELKRATELEPNLATAHAFRAQGLIPLERMDEATAEAKRALELDPFSVTTSQILGTIYLYSDRADEAIELYSRALELDPDSPFPLGNLGLCYVRKGMVEKGLPLVERAVRISATNPSAKSDLAYAYGKAGRMEDVRKILAELLEMHEKSKRAAPAIAGVYATLGENDKAFEWLDKAIEEHSPYLSAFKLDFVYGPLRSDPRYAEVVRRIGLIPD